VELVVRLRQRFGVDCQGFVFETPTVTALSERIVRAVAVGEQGATSPLPEGTAAASFESPAPVMYDPTWERAVLDFHRAAFGTLRRAELVEPRWRWMFLSSAERMGSGPRVWLYHIGDSVVGHMGSFPVSVWVNGAVLRADWLVETYVLPEYQSRAIGPRLLAAAQSGTSLPLSLGQSETMRDIQYRMGWKAVGRMRTAVLLVRPERVLRGKLLAPVAFGVGLVLRARQAVTRLRRPRIDIELKPVERYTEDHTELWSKMAASVRCGVVRDASYLNWKYVDQPGQSFLRLDAFVDHALVGSTIWSIREPDSAYRYRRALLIDVLAPIETEAERRRLEVIVLAGCSAVADRGADMVLCPHLSEPLSGVLRRCGFSFREPGRFLLVHAERLPATAAAHVLEESGWHVTLGDSDIDRPW
jgi:GNAT superfamily N-acetyltransferase